MDNSRAVYGIDLGTTYSCISQVDKFDQAVVLRNFEGDSTTPSAVYFEPNNKDKVIIGKEAKEMLATEPENTVVFVKREMGNDGAFDKTNNKFPYHYDPSEISAFILKKLVQDANSLADNPEPIKDVVITCPAYFGTKERLQTKQAGEIAGLNVLAIINEPTAAAISYGVRLDERRTILVYDLGGGTFDVTIIQVDHGAIKVVATGGDHHLGGVDWDTALSKYMLTAFNTENGTDYSFENDAILRNSLLLEAEMKKKNLTAKEVIKWNFTYEGQNMRLELTRQQFNDITANLLEETIEKTRDVIEIAKQKGYSDPDMFLLVGGSSRMPQIKERVDAEFGCDASFHDPDECVAKGAAIYAMNEAYSQAVKDYEEGERDDKPKPITGDRTTVVNVTSKTYGTDVDGGKVNNLIFANTSLPCSVKATFSTMIDNQPYVPMKVFESDFTDSKADVIVDENQCMLVDDHKLMLTKQWPMHTPVEVTFAIDSEGILSCQAKVDNDVLDFTLKITGVKSSEELSVSKSIIASKTIE
ncbi:MAG: Hsp70 family protein [Prevotella sp.]|nr:Hsp70 family protein [Prevotella sp.]